MTTSSDDLYKALLHIQSKLHENHEETGKQINALKDEVSERVDAIQNKLDARIDPIEKELAKHTHNFNLVGLLFTTGIGGLTLGTIVNWIQQALHK